MRTDSHLLPPALQFEPRSAVPCLALRPAEAAKALSISEKHLRSIEDLPKVRLGTAVLYPVHAIKAWLDAHLEPLDEPVSGEMTD